MKTLRVADFNLRSKAVILYIVDQAYVNTKCILTHWGRVTHICNLAIIGSDNGLSPGRRQAIIWTNDGILLIGPLGTNFSEILIAIETFSCKKMHLKISSAKWSPFCLSLNVLKMYWLIRTPARFNLKLNNSSISPWLKKLWKILRCVQI